MKRWSAAVTVALLWIAGTGALGGCGSRGADVADTAPTGSPSASAPATPDQSDPPASPTGRSGSDASAEWSSGPLAVNRSVPVPPVPVLRGIRSARHSGYDRITFDFAGTLPGYQVRYVDTVIEDGSGHTVRMPGRRYLQIRFEPAQAHSDTGDPTVTPRRRTLDYPMLRGYVINGDFEAVLNVALGLDDVVGFRVGEIPGTPGRIYVDVAA
jgi:hypothetical protein